MIVFDGNKILLGNIDERITQWEVWFNTPWGLFKSIHEAVEFCKNNEVDPEMAIVPCPVAITNSIYEAYIRG